MSADLRGRTERRARTSQNKLRIASHSHQVPPKSAQSAKRATRRTVNAAPPTPPSKAEKRDRPTATRTPISTALRASTHDLADGNIAGRMPRNAPNRNADGPQRPGEDKPRSNESAKVTQEQPSGRHRPSLEKPTAIPEADTPPTPPVVTRTATQLMSQADDAKQAGQYDEAAELMRTLIETFPAAIEAPFAAYSLGILYVDRLHQPHRAINAFKFALRSPKLPAALRSLAQARLSALRAEASDEPDP